MKWGLFFTAFTVASCGSSNANAPAPSFANAMCQGPLIHAVQDSDGSWTCECDKPYHAERDPTSSKPIYSCQLNTIHW